MHTLHIHGSSIASIDEHYEEILEQMPEKRLHFGYNLDALFDILSEGDIDRIVIHKSRYLKESLDASEKDLWPGELPTYYKILDIFTDLDHVDIILQDD